MFGGDEDDGSCFSTQQKSKEESQSLGNVYFTVGEKYLLSVQVFLYVLFGINDTLIC